MSLTKNHSYQGYNICNELTSILPTNYIHMQPEYGGSMWTTVIRNSINTHRHL
jgi:hypothetical protein